MNIPIELVCEIIFDYGGFNRDLKPTLPYITELECFNPFYLNWVNSGFDYGYTFLGENPHLMD